MNYRKQRITIVVAALFLIAAVLACDLGGRVSPQPLTAPTQMPLPSRPTLLPATSPPAAPSNLRALQVTRTEIVVTWQDNSNNEAGFRVYLAGTDVVARVGPNETRAVLGNLTCNVQYQYTVRAVNAAGESAPSNAIDVTTAPCQ
jgi:hypothetical protein